MTKEDKWGRKPLRDTVATRNIIQMPKLPNQNFDKEKQEKLALLDKIVTLGKPHIENIRGTDRVIVDWLAIVDYILSSNKRAEKELIIWALQAEAKSEPKFATEALAVAHRLVERLKELDPEFEAYLKGEGSVH